MTGQPPGPEPELGEVEWLDGGGPNDPVRPPPPSRIPRAAWYGLIGVVAVAVVVALTVSRHSSHRAARPSPTPTPTTSATPSPSTSQPSRPSSTPPAVTVRNLGHPLLAVPRGVELYATGAGSLLRIELATGRITRTEGIGLDSTSPSYLIAGPHEAIVKSYDSVPGFVIPDGREPQPLPDALTTGSGLFPGPDPAHVWVADPTGDGRGRSRLVGVDGRPTTTTLPWGATQSDGAGYLLANGIGGVYDLRPGSVQRVTSGLLLAVGPTRWLTVECDEHFRCTLDAIDRATGAHHVLGPSSYVAGANGIISPDGRTAALAGVGPNGTTVHLIDLATGADRATSVDQEGSGGTPGLVWTPDSRWLLATDSSGRIVAVDRNGHVRVLTDGAVTMYQLALKVQ